MALKARKRRSPGEGSVWPYRTKAGQLRYAIGYVRLMPDGTRKAVTRRTGSHGERWTTERDAKRALREVLVAADKGELVDPSKQLVGAYLEEWLAGLRLAPSTVASYRKMRQNLAWATGYNVLTVPLAAGVLAPIGFVLPPAVGAIMMSLSTIVVALNAQLLRRVNLRPPSEPTPAARRPAEVATAAR